MSGVKPTHLRLERVRVARYRAKTKSGGAGKIRTARKQRADFERRQDRQERAEHRLRKEKQYEVIDLREAALV